VGFARAAGFHGICNVEWKRHEGNGQYYFIEANPRICQFNILYSRAGLNLLLWQYTELVLGREPECDLTATGTRHFFCEELSDLRAYAAGGGTPFLRWLTYGRTIGKPVEFGSFARDDPLPGVVALVEDLAVTVKRSLIRRRKHRPGEDMLS